MTNIKLRVGQTVELNNGEVHKVARMHGDDPLRVDGNGFGPFVIDSCLYHKDGRFGSEDQDSSLTVARIISEPDEPAYDPADDPRNPDKLPLCKMSDRVIAMIVRAERREEFSGISGKWFFPISRTVSPDAIFRIRRTVTIQYDCDETGEPIMDTGRKVG